ncbi:acyl transferase/acyl hydrolase/lysophospholipase [Syncephalis plumigaleata]|nr:acyl transferase/acyl hydrolase/lysophospholipase [Syncephalis plumigaleata]
MTPPFPPPPPPVLARTDRPVWMTFDEELLEDSDSESHTKTSSTDDVVDDGKEQSSARSFALGWFSHLLDKRNELSQWSTMWLKEKYFALLNPHDRRDYYEHLMSIATNYEQWASAASILDQQDGKEAWKQNPVSSDYDYEILRMRVEQLRAARESNDISAMIFLLRSSLSRHFADMGNPRNYAHTRIGTKKLIEEFIEEVVLQLNYLSDANNDEWTSEDARYEFFINVRRAYGRTALLLSGGATFGLTHTGVIRCLKECRLLPRIISGTSSGSIIAALICSHTDEEVDQLLQPGAVELKFFDTLSEDGLYNKISRFLKHGNIYDTSTMKESLRNIVGDLTFQEAFYRTRRILNIAVSSSTVHEMPQLLNYLTTPNVVIWSAVMASCAVPLVFQSTPLMIKDQTGQIVPWNMAGHRWIDGSVETDLPMNKLSELFNINHFIVCQVNPHVIPFLRKSIAETPLHRAGAWMMNLAVQELQHRLAQLDEIGIMPDATNKVRAILSQRYEGDITIIPDIAWSQFPRLLVNPSDDMMTESMLRGERATWPKIAIIRNHCRIELTIDEIIYRLRLRRFDATRHSLASRAPRVTFSSVSGRSRQRMQQRVMNDDDPEGRGGIRRYNSYAAVQELASQYATMENTEMTSDEDQSTIPS